MTDLLVSTIKILDEAMIELPTCLGESVDICVGIQGSTDCSDDFWWQLGQIHTGADSICSNTIKTSELREAGNEYESMMLVVCTCMLY